MLLELAACNAAFAVIKEAVQHSGDIMSAGQALFSYFDNEASLQKKLTSKSGSKINTDLEEFVALEQIKKQKAEIERLMTYCGRAGLIDDWRLFQVEAAKRREQSKREAVRAKIKRRNKIIEAFWLGCLSIVLSCFIYLGIIVFELVKERA